MHFVLVLADEAATDVDGHSRSEAVLARRFGDDDLLSVHLRGPAIGPDKGPHLFTRLQPNTARLVQLTENELRQWAAGSYPDEAAVELLIRSGWIRRTSFATGCTHPLDSGRGSWIDWEAVDQILTGESDSAVLAASGGELRILKIAHCIAHGLLVDAVPGLDRRHLDLVLAAIAHAGGPHQHNGPLAPDPDGRWTDRDTGQRMTFPLLGSLHPWPTDENGTR